MTSDDFKPNADESEHSECVYPVFTQHKLPSRPVITIRSHSNAALLPKHEQIYTQVLQNSEKGRLTIVLGQRDKFKEHRHTHVSSL
jgi:hypothetical protein